MRKCENKRFLDSCANAFMRSLPLVTSNFNDDYSCLPQIEPPNPKLTNREFKMYMVASDGCVIDCSQKRYREEMCFNGYSWVPRCSRFEPWENSMQFLYPKNGKYYLASFTFDSKVNYANPFPREEVVRWLLANNHKLPDDLQSVAKQMVECT